MKKIIFLVLALFLGMFSVSGADLYTVYQPSYQDNSLMPNSIYVAGGLCSNVDCTQVGGFTELYNGNAGATCWNTFVSGGSTDVDTFVACMDSARIAGNVHPINAVDDFIIVKYDTDASFGYVTYFSAFGDQFFVKQNRKTELDCNYDICFQSGIQTFEFQRPQLAIAEVGQLNVRNTANDLLPIQVTVPVEIEETVCSAFRFATPDAWRPNIINGFSDYSSDVLLSLNISNNATGVQYDYQEANLQIEADSCVSLVSFNQWTPALTLENEAVKFRVESLVTDTQVESSLVDWAESVEIVNPLDLTGVCWARAYDFTLSNIEDFELSTSVAQISQGESLYALVNSGAFRDNSIDPMVYRVEVLFDSASVYSTVVSDLGMTDLSFDLTSSIAGLPTGNYEVSMVFTPVGVGCTEVSPVTLTQNLELFAPEVYDVTFEIMGVNNTYLEGAQIDFELLSARDYFVTAPTFLGTGYTDSNGTYVFADRITGDYTYTVSMPGYESTTRTVTIGSETTIRLTLSEENSAPVIDLPDEFVSYYLDDINFDVSDYVYDYNELFSGLTVTYEVVSGNYVANYMSPDFTLQTGMVTSGILRVTVTDSFGESSSDETFINFIDNVAPLATEFYANPDVVELGDATNFVVSITDSDTLQSDLTCTIDFGDFNSMTDICSNLNGLSYTYADIGTYNVDLTINDGFNSPVYAYEQVVVWDSFVRTQVVDFFATPDYLQVNALTTFTVDVDAENVASLMCTIDYGDGRSSSTDFCYNMDGLTHSYSTAGTYNAVLTIDDGSGTFVYGYEQVIVWDTIIDTTVLSFVANPDTLVLGDSTDFTISVNSTDMSTVICSVDFGDGVTVTDLCTSLNTISHTYAATGTFNAILTVNDQVNPLIFAFEQVNVLVDLNMPTINSFTVDSSNGVFVPTNLTFDYDVTHYTPGTPMTCSINVLGVNYPLATCSGSIMFSDYNVSGVTTFTLTAVDNASIVATSDITMEFFREEDKLENMDVGLIVDSKIAPGPFDFTITIENEVAARRMVNFKPTINCLGTENQLSNTFSLNGVIDAGVMSSVKNDLFSYDLTIDTTDFKSKVPKDVWCNFRVEVFDDIGSSIDNLSKVVMFVYPEEEVKIQSIRGKGSDVLSYMTTALSGSVDRGFNSLTFKVANNEAEVKELDITVSSIPLGVDFSIDKRIGMGETKDIEIPLFIGSDVESGKYPIRFSVYDGTDKQVRYSYVVVE